MYRYNPTADQKYQDFCKQAGGEEAADKDEDDDVVLEDGQNIELNNACPITLCSVWPR